MTETDAIVRMKEIIEEETALEPGEARELLMKILNVFCEGGK